MIFSATMLWAILQMMKYCNTTDKSLLFLSFSLPALFLFLYKYFMYIFFTNILCIFIIFICTMTFQIISLSLDIFKFAGDNRNGLSKFTKEMALQSHSTMAIFSEKGEFGRSLDCNGKSAELNWKECLRAKGKKTGNKLGAGGGPGWKKEEKEELRSARRQFGSPCSRLAATKWFTKQ